MQQSELTSRQIFLIGMPGSGKSTVGRQLAKRLRLPFFDSDEHIEHRLGCSIGDYFAREGEQAFRDVEAQVLAELAGGQRAVIATGGGAVLRESNRALMHGAGRVIYLSASPDDLFRRVRHDTRRPLLQVDDPIARLRSLHVAREPLYRATAHVEIASGRVSGPLVVDAVVQWLDQGEAGLTGP